MKFPIALAAPLPGEKWVVNIYDKKMKWDAARICDSKSEALKLARTLRRKYRTKDGNTTK